MFVFSLARIQYVLVYYTKTLGVSANFSLSFVCKTSAKMCSYWSLLVIAYCNKNWEELNEIIQDMLANFVVLKLNKLQAICFTEIFLNQPDKLQQLPWVFDIYATFYEALLEQYPATDITSLIVMD